MVKKTESAAPSAEYDAEAAADRINFFAFLEGMGRKVTDPLSAEAVELQAQYVKELPQHPMDVLNRIMVNPFCTPGERISAAKALMEYSMRKVPSNIELSGKGGGPIKIDAAQLEALSAEDLEALQTILSKTAKE